MKKRNVILTLDKAKEWYKKGGELREVALQAYKEEELKIELPKTWEEFCENYPTKSGECFISNTSEIIPITSRYRVPSRDKNIVPSKEVAEAHLALIQLHQLRDCYRQGWVHDWRNNKFKYCIVRDMNGLRVGVTNLCSKFLTFQSKEIAETFLINFEDLIVKTGDLM